MSSNTSHDPKTDHRGLYFLIGIAVFGIIGICIAVASPTSTPDDFQQVGTVDDCLVYQFKHTGKTHFMVRCPSDTTAVTHADGTTTTVTVVE